MIYIIIGIIIVLLLIYILITYNSFLKLNNKVNDNFMMMDVYLKKRWDLIPDIVEAVKAYVGYEEYILENIIKIKSSIYDNLSQKEKVAINIELTRDISRIMLIAENYPSLNTSENFLKISNQLSKIEEEIASSSKYYNEVVKKLNDKVTKFPSSIVASIFEFNEEKIFEDEYTEREIITIEI